MALISVVHRASLGSRERLDPEYYRPEYLQLDSLLAGRTCRKLSTLSREINCGPFGSTVLSDTYTPKGILVIRPFNVKDCRVDDEDIVYISKEDVKTKNLKTYSNGDIVFSRVGDIRCGIIDNFDGEVTISPNIIAVKLNRNIINPYYVSTFMNTKFGYAQLERTQKIVAQPTIETETVKELLVPRVSEDFQSDIEHNVKLAFSWQDNSKSLYSQAENLLLEELGLNNFKPKYELSYSANLSKAFGAYRVDAEYFQPVYETLLKRIKEFEFNKLGEIAERVATKLKPNPEEVYEYIEIRDIDIGIGETNYTERLGKDLPPNARIPINGGELIISKVRPTRGAISIISKELNASVICSSAFSVFKAESPLKEYVCMVSRSIVGRLQMERPTTGTSYPTIDDKDIEDIEIPLLPSETQQNIASLVRQSHAARKKAEELLKEAKSKVENLIEGRA